MYSHSFTSNSEEIKMHKITKCTNLAVIVMVTDENCGEDFILDGLYRKKG